MRSHQKEEGVDYVLTMSGALDAKLNRLADSNSMTPGEVLAKAVALYEFALLANGLGRRLAVVDQTNKVCTEIKGL